MDCIYLSKIKYSVIPELGLFLHEFKKSDHELRELTRILFEPKCHFDRLLSKSKKEGDKQGKSIQQQISG